MSQKEMRKYSREHAAGGLCINDSRPFQGGTLHDISVGGVAVWYLPETPPSSEPLHIGQALDLHIGDVMRMPCRVVRTFEHGFAAEFETPKPLPN
jgi:hypothetical protein